MRLFLKVRKTLDNGKIKLRPKCKIYDDLFFQKMVLVIFVDIWDLIVKT